MSTQDFLFELGCEELPTSALKKAGTDLVSAVRSRLDKSGLSFSRIEGIAAPRRLGVLVRDLELQQPDQRIVLRGPSKAVGFDEQGQPSRALLGFCNKNGIQPGDLSEIETPKGIWLEYQGTQPGAAAAAVMPALCSEAIDALPLPKRMRWGSTRQEFTRPVLWLVMMLGEDVLPATLFDRQSGNQSRGHRVHSPGTITIETAGAYFDTLRAQRVIAAFGERRDRVKALAESESVAGQFTVVTDDSLVDEVCALVEWPVPLMGQFDPSFLDVPGEALISSMKEHQKYFHVVDPKGALTHRFVTMANLESKDPALVIQGNETVLRARLSDAKFFWDTDLKTPLASRAAQMDKIVFHEALGTLGDKCRRAGAIAAAIAPMFHVKPEQAEQASLLAKCDLLSEMVLEFADLQGLMGTYYARREGIASDIAEALHEVYKPAGANDDTPATATGQVIAIADKLDTLVGLFAVGQPPTGSKDPFALRRAALGILRIVADHGQAVDLGQWIDRAYQAQGSLATSPEAPVQVRQFFRDRLKVMLTGAGYKAEVFEAVMAAHPSLDPVTISARVRVLSDSLGSDDLVQVAAGSKRIANLMDKAAADGGALVDPRLFAEPAENDLNSATEQARTAVKGALDNGDFGAALSALAALREPIDGYFDSVMVNADDSAVKANRLAALGQLQALFAQVADLSQVSA